MNNSTPNYEFDDANLSFRNILKTLFQSWYIILFLIVLGAAAAFVYEWIYPVPTIYKATAVLQNTSSDLSELMYDQDTLNSVAHILNTTTDTIRQPNIYQRSDKSLFNISVQSSDPATAIIQANAWADAINYQTHYYITDNAKAAIIKSEKAVELADSDLFTYLYEQNLGMLTWSQLLDLTGLAPNIERSDVQLSTATEQLVTTNALSVTLDQKIQISKLMREKIAAEVNYQSVAGESNEILNTYKPKDYYIVAYAKSVEVSSQPHLIRDVIFGGLLGLLLAVFGVSLVEWWRDTGRNRK